MEEAYILLIRAIVQQAVKDWRNANRILKKNPASYASSDRVREVERFFRSDWFYFLTGMEGETAIKELEKWDGSL